MDRFSPVAPAAIRVQVIPVGPIAPSGLRAIARRLQSEASILPLARLEAPSEPPAGLSPGLSPQAFPQGALLLHFTPFASSEHEQQLAPFELFRDPLLVLGVSQGLSGDEGPRQEELKAAAECLRERHPRAVHRHLLVLEAADDDRASVPDNVTVVKHNRSSDGADDSPLDAALCEVAGRFLVELSTYAKAMQASPGVQTPGQTARSLQRIVSLWGEEVRRPASGSGSATPTPSHDLASPVGEESSRPPSRSLAASPPPTSFEQMPMANRGTSPLGRSDSTASNRSKSGKRVSTQDPMAVHGFGSGAAQAKGKERGKARIGIVIGHIYLMAGQWGEAIRVLADHTNVARKLADSLWHAKGLEGIVVCMLLLAWARVEFTIPSVCSERSITSHARKISASLSSDAKAGDSAHDASVRRLSASLPDLLTQILILYSSSEGPLELPFLVVAEAKVRFGSLMTVLLNANEKLDGPHLAAIVERNSASTLKKPTVSPAGANLSKSSIAALVADAQPTEEDEVAIPDHVQILGGMYGVYAALNMDRKKGLVLRELVTKLTLALNQARKVGAAEAGIHPAASLSVDMGADSILAIAADRDGVNALISQIAQIFGIDLMPARRAEGGGSSGPAVKVTLGSRGFGNDALKAEIMRLLVAFCEAFPDPYGVLRLEGSSLSSCTPAATLSINPDAHSSGISREEQIRHASTMSRTIGVSKHLGLLDVQADYWDPFLVRDVGFAETDVAHKLIPQSQIGSKAKPVGQRSSDNPLLYDPHATRSGGTVPMKQLLIRNEPQWCLVTLQNPLEVSVDIESIQVEIEGSESKRLETKEFKTTTLGPRRFQQVSFQVSPNTLGEFNIIGCRIKIAGCRGQLFPIFSTPWASPPDLLVKHQGQDARDTEERHKLPSETKGAIVAVHVVPAMPLLELESSSIEKPSLMLLDGEQQTLQVVVRNSPRSAPAAIFKVVEERGVLQHVPGDDEVKTNDGTLAIVQPGGSAALAFNVFGKAGVSEVELQLYYGPSPLGQDDKFARLLPVPFKVTVDAALEIRHAQVMDVNDREFILSFDLTNYWPKPLYYRCEARQGSSEEERVLAPAEITRLSLNVQRWPFKTKALTDIYEDLLKRVGVYWRTWEGERFGTVDLRGLALSPEQLETVRGGLQRMHVHTIERGELRVGSFIVVRVELVNGQDVDSGPLVVELRLPHNGERRVVSVGVQHRLLPPIAAKGTAHVDFVICPLIAGEIKLHSLAGAAHFAGAKNDGDWHTESSLGVKIAHKVPVK